MYSSFLESFLSVIMNSSPLYCPRKKHKSQLIVVHFFNTLLQLFFICPGDFLLFFQDFPFQISLLIYRHLFKSIGEGNGTPLQYSCLENSMDGGAWWAAVHGAAKSKSIVHKGPVKTTKKC